MTWFLKRKIKKAQKKAEAHAKDLDKWSEIHNKLVMEYHNKETIGLIPAGQTYQQLMQQQQAAQQPMQQALQIRSEQQRFVPPEMREKIDKRKMRDKQEFAQMMIEKRNAARAKKGMPPIKSKAPMQEEDVMDDGDAMDI